MGAGERGRELEVGFTGVGGRGASLLELCLEIDDVAVPAVCDIQERHRERAREEVTDSGRPAPATYADHAELVARGDLDGVVIATPWQHHIPMAITAMEAGVDVGLEVGPASSVAECWDLVGVAERTGRRCMLLENCCYYRDCLAVLEMVRDGVFGELVRCEGGYCHDLREPIVTGDGADIDRDGLTYRGQHNAHRNGDIYPTHGLGPMAKCLEINAGNRFESLTATATKEAGLTAYAERKLPEGAVGRETDWAVGDVVTTTLRCAGGETLTLTHDVSLPRPYSNRYHVQGTRGLWRRERDAVYIDGESPSHEWEPLDGYREEYDHPLWEAYGGDDSEGHGDIDYLVLRAYLGALRGDHRPPIDVYDTATWMALGPLSERSVALGGEPVSVPEFTGGAWLDRSPVLGTVERL